jgi:hypothetical protein
MLNGRVFQEEAKEESVGVRKHFLVERIIQALLAKEFFLQLFTCFSLAVLARRSTCTQEEKYLNFVEGVLTLVLRLRLCFWRSCFFLLV